MNSMGQSFETEASILSTLSRFRNFTFDVDELQKKTIFLEKQLQSVISQIKTEYAFNELLSRQNNDKRKKLDEREKDLFLRKDEIERNLNYVSIVNAEESIENTFEQTKQENMKIKGELDKTLKNITKFRSILLELDLIDSDAHEIEAQLTNIENQKSEFSIRRAQAERVLMKQIPRDIEYERMENSNFLSSLQVNDIDILKHDVRIELSQLEDIVFRNNQKKKSIIIMKKDLQRKIEKYNEAKMEENKLFEEEEENYDSYYAHLTNLDKNRHKINKINRSLKAFEKEFEVTKIRIQALLKKKHAKIEKLQQRMNYSTNLDSKYKKLKEFVSSLRDKYQQLIVTKHSLARKNELVEQHKQKIIKDQKENEELRKKAEMKAKQNRERAAFLAKKKEEIQQLKSLVIEKEIKLNGMERDVQYLENESLVK